MNSRDLMRLKNWIIENLNTEYYTPEDVDSALKDIDKDLSYNEALYYILHPDEACVHGGYCPYAEIYGMLDMAKVKEQIQKTERKPEARKMSEEEIIRSSVESLPAKASGTERFYEKSWVHDPDVGLSYPEFEKLFTDVSTVLQRRGIPQSIAERLEYDYFSDPENKSKPVVANLIAKDIYSSYTGASKQGAGAQKVKAEAQQPQIRADIYTPKGEVRKEAVMAVLEGGTPELEAKFGTVTQKDVNNISERLKHLSESWYRFGISDLIHEGMKEHDLNRIIAAYEQMFTAMILEQAAPEITRYGLSALPEWFLHNGSIVAHIASETIVRYAINKKYLYDMGLSTDDHYSYELISCIAQYTAAVHFGIPADEYKACRDQAWRLLGVVPPEVTPS